MSFHSSSTQSSPECFEDSNAFEHIPINTNQGSPEPGFADSAFYEHFPDSQNKGAEFFSVFEKPSSAEKEPSRIRSFRYKQNIYALSAPNLGRSVILELIKTGEKEGMNGIYLALDRRLPGFMNQFKLVSYIGFKQMNPKLQKFVTPTKWLLVVYMSLTN